MKAESGKEKRMVQELDLLKKHQKISVKELAAALGVSEMTVRRDLELLRKNHVLERSYGYATLVEGGNGYSYEGENYDLRRARLENFAEKDRIAQICSFSHPPGRLGVPRQRHHRFTDDVLPAHGF